MAKIKKVSINAFEKVVKENFENTVTKEWFGIPITITRTISFEEVATFVAEVAENCFLSDGRYIPEAMQPLIYCGIIRHYTNINLPSNLSYAYDLVMQSGIVEFVMSDINDSQLSDIVNAIKDRVDYSCDVKTDQFNKAIEEMSLSMSRIKDATGDIFEQLSTDDIKKVINVYGDDQAVEERIVKEYMKQKKMLETDGDN